MPNSVNLDKNQHAACNTFPRLIAKDARIGKVRFWDVGTGNCNTFYDPSGQPLFYFDFGGNAGTGAKTYPNPEPVFDWNKNVRFVMSHWDNDHVFSLKKKTDTGQSPWLGPREDLAPETQRLLVKHVKKSLRVWRSGKDDDEISWKSDKGVEINLVRCEGNHLEGPKKRKERNDTGIALIAEVKTPTLAKQVVDRIVEQAKKAPMNANAAYAEGAKVVGVDVLKEDVLRCAEVAKTENPLSADGVKRAAEEALKGGALKGATEAVLKALDIAKNQPGQKDKLACEAIVAGCEPVDANTAAVLKAISASCTLAPNDAYAAAKAGCATVPLLSGTTRTALLAAVTAVDAALGAPNNAAGAAQAARNAAGGLMANDRLVKPVLDAADLSAKNFPLDAVAAAKAAVNALLADNPLLATAGAALKAAVLVDPKKPLAALGDALRAAVTAIGARRPLLKRVLEAILSKHGVGTQQMADAAVTALDGPPKADAIIAVVAMAKKLLAGGATNQNVLDAAGKPDPAMHHKNHVIKAAQNKVKELKKTQKPRDVFDAAKAALVEPPKEWVTRILLTGDACYQALPSSVLKKAEWDLLLAYHHGTRLGFVEGESSKKNHHPSPVAALPGVSTIIYSAGRRASGKYVHKHPEDKSIKKYREAGWTREFHTHPWPANAKDKTRGNREFKLPPYEP